METIALVIVVVGIVLIDSRLARLLKEQKRHNAEVESHLRQRGP